MISRANGAGVGVRNPHGGLKSNSVRAALHYAKKRRIARATVQYMKTQDGDTMQTQDGDVMETQGD